MSDGERAERRAGCVGTLGDPGPEAARSFAADAFERGALLTVFGRCTVSYDGRATSSLGPGERLVVSKPDGTTLVHSDAGQEPVSWLRPGSSRIAGLRDGRVALVARRESPAEELAVRFEAVLRATAYAPTDERDPSVSGTEADLTERLLADPDRLEPGFRPLATERETPVGAVDIYGEDAEGRRVVVEVKRRRAGPDAVGQLRRYVAALRRDLHAETELRGVLVAPSATDRARELLAAEGLEFVPLEP